MKREHELKHVSDGPEPDERPDPNEGIGLVRFDVHCDGNAADVLARAKEVFRIVLSESPVGWPSLDEWRKKLPRWFVEECAPEKTKEEADRWLKWWRGLSWEEQRKVNDEKRWSLANWLYWFEPKQRSWYWWDSLVESPDLVRVAAEVTEWPFPWDALKWLFRASGAKSVTAEE